ncbi:hypothetical protein [Haloplanus halobius]|uniref:DUF7847 domain-containing protein n=1 Tax=Haloplanus halobius TaxID=2934938 RepID=UPI00200C7242|nr:hypothetical protein [Haloplanus sp. XH21]
MAVLKALRQTPSTLRHNPILFVPVLVILLFQIPQLVLQAVNPLIASIVSMILSLALLFVMPFFQAGIVGMADEALDGQTSLDSFLREGKSNYVSVLVASLVLVAVNFTIGFVAFFVAIFGGFALFSDTSGGVGTATLVILGLIVALLVLAYLLFAFFVQFYSQAIVIDDLGAVDGLKHSISVVRHHLVSTLGYSVLVGVLGSIVGGVFGIGSLLASPQSTGALHLPQVSIAGVVGVSFLIVAVGTLFGGFFGVYSVAFYRSINEGASDGLN